MSITVFESYDGEIFSTKEAAQEYCRDKPYRLGLMGWEEKTIKSPPPAPSLEMSSRAYDCLKTIKLTLNSCHVLEKETDCPETNAFSPIPDRDDIGQPRTRHADASHGTGSGSSSDRREASERAHGRVPHTAGISSRNGLIAGSAAYSEVQAVFADDIICDFPGPDAITAACAMDLPHPASFPTKIFGRFDSFSPVNKGAEEIVLAPEAHERAFCHNVVENAHPGLVGDIISHHALRDSARAQQSPSRRGIGDGPHIGQSLTVTIPLPELKRYAIVALPYSAGGSSREKSQVRQIGVSGKLERQFPCRGRRNRHLYLMRYIVGSAIDFQLSRRSNISNAQDHLLHERGDPPFNQLVLFHYPILVKVPFVRVGIGHGRTPLRRTLCMHTTPSLPNTPSTVRGSLRGTCTAFEQADDCQPSASSIDVAEWNTRTPAHALRSLYSGDPEQTMAELVLVSHPHLEQLDEAASKHLTFDTIGGDAQIPASFAQNPLEQDDVVSRKHAVEHGTLPSTSNPDPNVISRDFNFKRDLDGTPPAPAENVLGYQERVAAAHHALFHGDPTDVAERVARFFEEAVETCQAFGLDFADAHQLVNYTYDRPVGEPAKEIGAALLTLASLCVVAGYDMAACGEADLEKLQRPETVARIRAKRATRHGRGPLPGLDPAVRIAFGLEAQGHIPAVEAMLAKGQDWQEIGRCIGWDGETAKQYYGRHLDRAAAASEGSTDA